MLVVIVGPNLPAAPQTKGSYHVHAATCSDLQKGWIAPYAQDEQAVNVKSRVEAAEHVYDNGIMQEGETGADYLGDFHFAPCCDDLPRVYVAGHVIQVEETDIRFWIPTGDNLDDALANLSFANDGATVSSMPHSEVPAWARVFDLDGDGRSLWRVESGHPVTHEDVRNAAIHGRVTCSRSAGYNDVKVTRVFATAGGSFETQEEL